MVEKTDGFAIMLFNSFSLQNPLTIFICLISLFVNLLNLKQRLQDQRGIPQYDKYDKQTVQKLFLGIFFYYFHGFGELFSVNLWL